MTRRVFSLALGGLMTAAAQQRDPKVEAARRRLMDASRALQAGNAGLFLSFFDRKRLVDFGTLREWIRALTEQRDVASSVDVLAEDLAGETVKLQVDWILQITPARQPGAVETRQATIEVEMDGPQIVGVSSINLFRP